MKINSLELRNFRNYEYADIKFTPDINVIYGDNAQGKTNLLEAIFYLSTGKSFRAKKEEEMIRFNADEAILKNSIFSAEREHVIEATLFSDRKRKILKHNGIKLKSSSELCGLTNTVLFCPEDLNLIKSSAALRRKFLDTAICQLRPKYARAISEYAKLYEHKTRILRDWNEKPSLLELLDDFNLKMAQIGAFIVINRAAFIKKLNFTAQKYHFQCSGGKENLCIEYQTVSTIKNPLSNTEQILSEIMEHQQTHKNAELQARACLTGPHKDDFAASINGASVKSYGSQGQTRTAALSLKLAEREIHRDDIGEYPILLLDDVLSELDEKRKDFVLNQISEGQVFVTCCGNERLETLKNDKIIYISNGKIM